MKRTAATGKIGGALIAACAAGLIAAHAAGNGGGSCAEDLDGCGTVDFADLVIVLQNWGPCTGCLGDVDFDGSVGFTDLTAVLSAWGPC